MTFQNPSGVEIAALLTSARTIAVIGLSDRPDRPSYGVAKALRGFGYRIVPISPSLKSWEGLPAFATLDDAVTSLEPGERIDIVDVFRQPQFIAGIVDDCIRLKIPALWLQLGVVDDAAAQRAEAAGLTVVMDKCIKVERMRI